MGFAGFTDRELQVIALRTNGVRPAEIARRLGFKVQQAYDLTHDVYLKTGFRNVTQLAAWAKASGLDEILEPETSETRPRPGKPAPRKRTRYPLTGATLEP